MDVVIGQLVVVASFTPMRSCEYSDVGSGRLSTVVRTADVRFWKNGETLTTTDQDRLRNAYTVTIMFRRQKNGDKGVTVTQHQNNNSGHSDICPVQAMADLATRVRNYERQGQTNLRINSITTTDSDEIDHIPSKTILNQLRAATTLAGEERLGLRADCIGTHSIRSGVAMAMHLAGVPSETIQLVGRWRS